LLHRCKHLFPFLVIEIRQLTSEEGRQHLGALADVLLDCPQGGASVSFMSSLSKAGAESFFEGTLEKVRRGSPLQHPGPDPRPAASTSRNWKCPLRRRRHGKAPREAWKLLAAGNVVADTPRHEM
jgi:hypothetical protein